MADDPRLLAGRLGFDLDAGLKHVHIAVFVRHKEDVGTATAEELAEESLRTGKMFADTREGFFEAGAAGDFQLGDERFQLFAGQIDVGDLFDQAFVPRFEVLLFVDRINVDVSEFLDGCLEFVDLSLRGVSVHERFGIARQILPQRELDGEVDAEFLKCSFLEVLSLDLRFPPAEFQRVVVAIENAGL